GRTPPQSGANTATKTTGKLPTLDKPSPRDDNKHSGSCQPNAQFSLTSNDFPRITEIELMPKRRTLLILFASVIGLSTLLSGAAAQMGVEDIRPGMVGISRTVFDGTRVEEFKVNIIGVLENVIGPHRNLILAKLEGGPLAHTGVIAGMSGSPVYIN